MSQVYLKKCTDYNAEKIKKYLEEGFHYLGGLRKYFKKGETVLVKPNFLKPSLPEQAVTTHPAVIKALTEILIESGCRTIIGDSPGRGSVEKVLSSLGMLEYVEEKGIEVSSDRNFYEITNDKGKVLKRTKLIDVVKKADKIVTLAKLKTHCSMAYTGAVKNVYGCIPGPSKPELHFLFPDPDLFARLVVDLFNIIKPDFAIIDGITAMEGNGPGSGVPFPLNSLIMSEDSLAADVTAVELIGLKKDDVVILKYGAEEEIGEGNIEKIEIIGTRIEELRCPGFKKTTLWTRVDNFYPPLKKIVKRLFLSKPVIGRKRCIGCGACLDVCFANAAYLERNRVKFDYKKCIRCYCCQEICPEGAIRKKEGILMKIFALIKDYM